MRTLQNFVASALMLATGVAVAAPPPPQAMVFFHGKRPAASGAAMPGKHAAPRAPGGASNSFTFLSYPGTTYTGVWAINPGVKPGAKSQLVGSFGPGLGDTWESPVYGFGLNLSTAKGVMTESYRPLLNGVSQVSLNAINDHGLIAGTLTDSNNVTTGFTLAPDGTQTTIIAPWPNAPETTVTGVNNKGVVAGVYYSDDSPVATPFTYYKGVYTQLPLYPGSTYSWPNAINSAGDMVGNLTDQNGVNHGYLFRNNAYTLIDPPGSAYTIAIGLNDSDEIVGFYCTTVQDCTIAGPVFIQGFVYNNGVYTTLNFPGSLMTELDAVNNAGTIVGSYWDENNFTYSFLTALPAP